MNIYDKDTRIEIPLATDTFDHAAEGRENIGWDAGNRDRFVMKVTTPTLTLHLPKTTATQALRPVILICPGGGYGGLCLDKEGNQIAAFFNQHGIAAAVLKYRMPHPNSDPAAPDATPLPMQDAVAAAKLLAAGASIWHLDMAQFGIMGFSAGGHLAGFVGLHWKQLDIVRPAFLALIYPVVSADPTIGHLGSFKKLLGENASAEQISAYSNEAALAEDSPSLFLVHAADDTLVSIANSQALLEAAKKKNIPALLLTFSTGGHGFPRTSLDTEGRTWPDTLIKWIMATSKNLIFEH